MGKDPVIAGQDVTQWTWTVAEPHLNFRRTRRKLAGG